MPYTFPKCWLIRLRLARKQIASFFCFCFPKLLSGIFLLVWCHRGCSICRPNGFSNSSFSRAFERVFFFVEEFQVLNLFWCTAFQQK